MQSIFTHNTEFSLLYRFCFQPQKGCLWSPHINHMGSVTHSYQCSGESVGFGPEIDSLDVEVCGQDVTPAVCGDVH